MITKTKKNAVANIFARVWGAVAAFVFLPLYLHALGPEAFGLVALFTTLQISLTVAFTGWTKALRREFARDENSLPNGHGRRATLASFQVIYAFGAIAILLVGILLAYLLSRHWLQYDSLSQDVVTIAISLISASIAVQLLARAFQSALHGMQHQVPAVMAEVSWSLARAVLAVVAARVFDNSVIAFFCGFLLCDVLYMTVLRVGLGFALRSSPLEPWRFRDVKRLRRLASFSSGLTVIALAHLLNTQTDRVFISRILGLDALGAYNIAAALGLLPVVASTGLAVTAFPIFVRDFSNNNIDAVKRSFHLFSTLTTLLGTGIASFLIVYRDELLTFWIRDPDLVGQASIPSIGLIAGGYFLALQQIPYEYLLARGISRINVVMSLLCIPWSLVITPVAVEYGGLPGASLSWAMLMGLTTLGYLGFVMKHFFDMNPIAAIVKTALMPSIFFGVAAISSHAFLQSVGASGGLLLGLGIAVGGATLVCALIALPLTAASTPLKGVIKNV